MYIVDLLNLCFFGFGDNLRDTQQLTELQLSNAFFIKDLFQLFYLKGSGKWRDLLVSI